MGRCYLDTLNWREAVLLIGGGKVQLLTDDFLGKLALGHRAVKIGIQLVVGHGSGMVTTISHFGIHHVLTEMGLVLFLLLVDTELGKLPAIGEL